MRYIDVGWLHDDDTEPVRLLSEIDADGYEVRKIEIYRDGRAEYADAERSTGNAILGEREVPADNEIAADGQFRLNPTTGDQFERAWRVVRETGRYLPDAPWIEADDLPEWSWELEEVSAGWYRFRGRDRTGRTVECMGAEVFALVAEAHQAARRLKSGEPDSD